MLRAGKSIEHNCLALSSIKNITSIWKQGKIPNPVYKNVKFKMNTGLRIYLI